MDSVNITSLEEEIQQRAQSLMEKGEIPKFAPKPIEKGQSLSDQAKD